jgi:hypothetical protein
VLFRQGIEPAQQTDAQPTEPTGKFFCLRGKVLSTGVEFLLVECVSLKSHTHVFYPDFSLKIKHI